MSQTKAQLVGGVGISTVGDLSVYGGVNATGVITATNVTASNIPISVYEYGAVGDGVTDDTLAIQDAIDQNPGRKIYIPKGVYLISSQIDVTDNGTTLVGDGGSQSGTVIELSDSGQDGIVFSGCQFAGIVDIAIRSKVVPASGYCVTFGNGCFECFLQGVNCLFAFNGVLITGATETRISNLSLRYIHGTYGIRITGTNSNRSYRVIIHDVAADNPYPLTYGSVETWASSTSFSLQDIIFYNNRIYQCTQAGTSGLTGPSGVPGSGGLSCFTDEITDGTCKWKFVSSDLRWIVQDSYSYSVVIDKAAVLNGSKGYLMDDSLNDGGSYPVWAFVHDLECDHNFGPATELNRGEGFYATTSWWGSSLNSNGFVVGSNYRGEVDVTTTRIHGNAQHGVLIEAGPVDVNLHGNMIGDNSASQSNFYHGIVAGVGASSFYITSNKIGDLVGSGGNNQNSGVFVNGGGTDNYIISGNDVTGNTTAGISDGGNGSNSIVVNNLGYITGITSTAISKTLINKEYCAVVAAGVTITLPSSPQPGWEVGIAVDNFTDVVVAGNGSNIMALNEDFTMDIAYLALQFVYIDSVQGWRYF
jgi:hypothetical protein